MPESEAWSVQTLLSRSEKQGLRRSENVVSRQSECNPQIAVRPYACSTKGQRERYVLLKRAVRGLLRCSLCEVRDRCSHSPSLAFRHLSSNLCRPVARPRKVRSCSSPRSSVHTASQSTATAFPNICQLTSLSFGRKAVKSICHVSKHT